MDIEVTDGDELKSLIRGTDRGSLQTMDDPAFLAERRNVRETIEALQERLAVLDGEFIRRASLAWKGGAA